MCQRGTSRNLLFLWFLLLLLVLLLLLRLCAYMHEFTAVFIKNVTASRGLRLVTEEEGHG